MAIRAAAAAAVAGLSAAGRHATSALRHFSPQSARPRGFFVVGDTAAFTRPPLLLPHAPLLSDAHVLRRGLAVISGEGDHHSSVIGAEVSPNDVYDPIDPESPDDPETCFAYDERDLQSDETMWAMYERWCVFHGVQRDREDMLRRFSRFKDRACSIHEFNKSGKSWAMALNRHGDRTPEERARLYPPRTCVQSVWK